MAKKYNDPPIIEEIFDTLHGERAYISHPADIREYLLNHQNLSKLLPSIAKLIRDKFSVDTQTSLEMFHDPEAQDSYLVFYIRQDNYEEDIMDKIDSISDIFEPSLEEMSGWLLVTTDFSPPKH